MLLYSLPRKEELTTEEKDDLCYRYKAPNGKCYKAKKDQTLSNKMSLQVI